MISGLRECCGGGFRLYSCEWEDHGPHSGIPRFPHTHLRRHNQRLQFHRCCIIFLSFSISLSLHLLLRVWFRVACPPCPWRCFLISWIDLCIAPGGLLDRNPLLIALNLSFLAATVSATGETQNQTLNIFSNQIVPVREMVAKSTKKYGWNNQMALNDVLDTKKLSSWDWAAKLTYSSFLPYVLCLFLYFRQPIKRVIIRQALI